MLDYLSSALATLLVIIDPVLSSALFLGLTQGMSVAHRREVAWRGALIAFLILLGSGLFGARLLALLGITLAAFRIAGGLLLLSTAAEMVFGRRGQRDGQLAREAITLDHVRNIAAFPLAIPLVAGPGAITAMILLAGRANGDLMKEGLLYALAAFLMLVTYLFFLSAERLGAIIGITGRAVVTRLMGIILAALAVQFIVDGVNLLLH